ncbi:MAG: oligosaccharide flippase family protein [Patescibacteria group bacterium]
MARRPVLKNVAILTASGLCERAVGAAYRVFLARLAGSVALGLLQYCMPVLRLSLILCTLGLPQALTRVVAQACARHDEPEARAALGWSLRTAAVTGGIAALLLLLLAPACRRLFADERVWPLLRWLAPTIFFGCLSWILQAYFQGRNRMWAVAVTGLLEQGGKLAVTLVLLGLIERRTPGAIAAAALAAVACAEMAGLFFLLILGARSGGLAREGGGADKRALLVNSLPLMGDGLVFAVAGAVDVAVVPRRLIAAGLAQDRITALMGQAWGMALPTVFLPMVVIWPLAAATLPAIASSLAGGDLRGLRRRVWRTCAAVAAVGAAATGFFLLAARPLMRMLYACPEAASHLRAFSLVACPVYLASISGTLLAGLGRSAALFRQSLACAMLRTFLLYILTGMPGLGIAGAAVGIAAGNAALAAANLATVHRCLCPEKETAGGRMAASALSRSGS